MYIYSWKKIIKFWPILVIQLSKSRFFLMHVFTQSIVKCAPRDNNHSLIFHVFYFFTLKNISLQN